MQKKKLHVAVKLCQEAEHDCNNDPRVTLDANKAATILHLPRPSNLNPSLLTLDYLMVEVRQWFGLF